jgi:hypothetical protein
MTGPWQAPHTHLHTAETAGTARVPRPAAGIRPAAGARRTTPLKENTR